MHIVHWQTFYTAAGTDGMDKFHLWGGQNDYIITILPNFNSFSKEKHKKMSENGEIYNAGKNFTLPPALTAWTNSTSAVQGCSAFCESVARSW